MADTNDPSAEDRDQFTRGEKDIDGLPLRDHKKVDLKALLSHAPEEDDDEQESEEATSGSVLESSLAEGSEEASESIDDDIEDEEEDDENCPVSRQRRSSLRVQDQNLPDSLQPLCDRKAVRFADSMGLGLAAIRDLSNAEEPPEIPHSALTDLKLRKRRQRGRFHLIQDYHQPDVGDQFFARLDKQKVLLESSFACSRELTVSGVVRVANISFDKAVTIRYSIDSWATKRDVPANYVPNSTEGATDQFVFIIHLPEGFGDTGKLTSQRLQFAVSFRAGDETYWDNNDGKNYAFDCLVRSRDPSISSEAKTPDGNEVDKLFPPLETEERQ